MNKNKGIGLVEVLIGTTIIIIGILALIQVFGSFVSFALANDKNVQAAYLGEEALEAMSFLRGGSWTRNIAPLSTSTSITPFYLIWNSGADSWLTTTSPQYVDGVFLRKLTMTEVSRGSNGQISASGTNDPNTRFVTVTLQYYQGHATTTQTFSTYLINLYNN